MRCIRSQDRLAKRLQQLTEKFSLRTQAIVYAVILLPAGAYCLYILITALLQLIT